MKFILTHKSGNQYQVNTGSDMSIEDLIASIKSEPLLTLFNLDDTYAGVESPEFIDECEVTIEA
jgi:hypothetical protein